MNFEGHARPRRCRTRTAFPVQMEYVFPDGSARRAWHASRHEPQLTIARSRSLAAVLFRRANERFAAIPACTRSNCSRVTIAGTVAAAIHSSGGSGACESRGRPMGWVAERRTRAARTRVRLA
jgi:hypothetical protein